MSMTVNSVIEEMKNSRGFTMLIAFQSQKENGEVETQYRYLRQYFPMEDMEKMFSEFAILVSNDLNDSGFNLLKSAENIVNKKLTDKQLPSPGSIFLPPVAES